MLLQKNGWFVKTLIKNITAINLFLSLITVLVNSEEPWTHLYIHNINKRQDRPQKRSLLEITKQVPLFNQLIFSWNAFRPPKGYLSFWVSTRDATTKAWHPWHKMIEWGNNVQRSFLDKRQEGTSYFHVRLELLDKYFSDSFKIKIIAHEQATLNLVKTVFINTVNTSLFKTETMLDVKNLSTVIVKQVPVYSQRIDYPRAHHLCSPTATAMLVSYFTHKTSNLLRFSEQVYDSGLDSFGSWPFNTAHAFEQSKGKVRYHVQRLASFKQLHALLKRSIPVVVSVRGTLPGAAAPYNNGHLLVVVGYDHIKEKVLCHDPSFSSLSEVITTYDIYDFLKAWERSRRLAYVAEPQKKTIL
jgi:hypothetical protein